MQTKKTSSSLDMWGGIECSINRVGDCYSDQAQLSGHYTREDDIRRFAALGIKAMRYPVLWEKHAPVPGQTIDWTQTGRSLATLQELNIIPIAGLVHHGSGPSYSSFYDESFATGLARYAALVAEKFPWLEYYTPVNEPLTTARFCGLYGHWYPHGRDNTCFLKVLLSEIKATVLAMQAIRKINPAAKLVFTEDLAKIHSTPELAYQAAFENTRRWLSVDLLCGNVSDRHPLYSYLKESGITDEELAFFHDNACPPAILGLNYYVTSERYLDETVGKYPRHTWGGNGKHEYADVEVVRVGDRCMDGPCALLKEAWQQFGLPMAVTEVHLHCSREEQLRWFRYIWEAAVCLQQEGADIRAVTAWALLGSFDWCNLLTRQNGEYESGVFDIRGMTPRPTALVKMISALSHGKEFHHPVLEEEGWWKRSCRIQYRADNCVSTSARPAPVSQPVLITGKTGTLGKAFARICELRGIQYRLLGRGDLDIADASQIEKVIDAYRPWAVINTAGFVRVDDAENDAVNCFKVNSSAPHQMAAQCRKKGIQFMTFSSDLVFDGKKKDPYLESDQVSPLNIYGQSKAKAEQLVLSTDPGALIIRTSAFFGPWDYHNFVANALFSFKENLPFPVAHDVFISPTYVPDLVNTSLDLMLDEESGIWNLSNSGEVSWAMLAEQVAERSGYRTARINPIRLSDMRLAAPRPHYSVLKTEKGLALPSLENALQRFFHEQEILSL